MTAVLIGKHEPGSDAWHEARRGRLGGSEIAAVLGLSPFKSPFALWHEKAGNVPQSDGNQWSEWGQRLEPVVAAKFAENHPDWLLTATPGTFVHPERPWQSASPDAFVYGSRDLSQSILEIKTALRADQWGTPGTDEIPISYRCQVLWYLDVFGLDTARVAVLISGCDYREYVLHVDDAAREDQQLMRDAGQRFIDGLAAGIPPDIDSSYATLQTVRELHPDIEPGDVEVDPLLAERYVEAVLAAKAANHRKNEYTSRVLDALGRTRNAVVDGERFAYRSAKKAADGTPGVPYLASNWTYIENHRARTIKEAVSA